TRLRARPAYVALAAAVLMAATLPLAAGAARGGPFVTTQHSMVALAPDAPPNTAFQPIITVGDKVRGNYRFLSVPDGIGYQPLGNHGAKVYINHETSTS